MFGPGISRDVCGSVNRRRGDVLQLWKAKCRLPSPRRSASKNMERMCQASLLRPKTALPKMHMNDVLNSCKMESSQLGSTSVPPGWVSKCVEDTHCMDGPPEGSSPSPTRFVTIFCRDSIGYLAISSSLWIKATAPSPPRNRCECLNQNGVLNQSDRSHKI